MGWSHGPRPERVSRPYLAIKVSVSQALNNEESTQTFNKNLLF